MSKYTTSTPKASEDAAAILYHTARLEQQIEDLKAEVTFWQDMVDGVAEDFERELERLDDRGGAVRLPKVIHCVACFTQGRLHVASCVKDGTSLCSTHYRG